MNITEVKAFPVWIGMRNQLLVKIETDAGIHGWGESGFSGREQAVAGMIAHLREWLVGRDPMKRGALWQEMYRGDYFEGGRTITAAISAVDIALHDLVGKALGVPVYDLLGGKHRDFVPTFATARARGPEAMIDEARRILDAGWACMRLTTDSMGIDDDNVFEPRVSIARTADWLVEALKAAWGRPPGMVRLSYGSSAYIRPSTSITASPLISVSDSAYVWR